MTHRTLKTTLAALLAAALALPAAAQVGLQRQPLAQGRVPAIVWYPTAAAAQPLRLGPFSVNAAAGATPTAGSHPLLVVSHGTGGNELGHAWLAQALAAQGYVVLSLRHTGDNFEDRSGVADAGYFANRPRQLSQALDELLADARWAALIDSRRIAAFGHSAGGHSVLALAGGRPDRARWLAHCSADGAGLREDAALCALGGFSAERPAPRVPPQPLPEVRDLRIRAVVAAAPMTQALDPASLAAVTVPVLVEAAGRDEVLAPAHHGQAVCKAMPRARCVTTADAGHFASFHAGTGRLGPPGLDPAADPAGFDRPAWQAAALQRISAFLADALK